MKVAVIGGTGHAGSEISTELARRGHQVTVIARHPENAPKDAGITAVKGDINDSVAIVDLIRGHDAVVSAVMFSDFNAASLLDILRDAGVRRYLVVGGAGSLEIAPGVKLIEAPEFPKEFLPEATRGVDLLTYLRGVEDVEWTFLSPPMFFFEGPRLGSYRVGGDQLLFDGEGKSSISFADYAIALVDEIETPAHIRQRFTVGY